MYVFQVRGTLQEQRVILMLNSGATLNFINSSLVKKRGLAKETCAGFQVKVIGGTLLPCTHLVPQLSITMANQIVMEDFFIVDLDDMEVILGIQWMESLDEYTEFQADGLHFCCRWKEHCLKYPKLDIYSIFPQNIFRTKHMQKYYKIQ